jgi:flagellar hook-length control protein FliK
VGAAHRPNPRRPEQSLGETIRSLEPGDRAEVASAWNRAGGRPATTEPAVATGVEVNVVPARRSALSTAGDLTSSATGVEDVSVTSAPTVEVGVDGGDSKADSQQQPAGTAAPGAPQAATASEPATAATVEASEGRTLVRGLAASVQQATRTGESQIRLVLNPPELGQLDVRIEDGGNGVRVTLAAATSEAGELLLQHLPALRAALEARDLRVDRIEVQRADASELGHPDDQPQRRQDGGENERPEWSQLAALEQTGEQSEEPPAVVTSDGEPGSGLLDIVA